MQLQHLSHMTAMLETSASAMVNGRCQCCDESCLRYLTNQPARLSFPPQFVGCAKKNRLQGATARHHVKGDFAHPATAAPCGLRLPLYFPPREISQRDFRHAAGNRAPATAAGRGW